jgi:hypothetical protein
VALVLALYVGGVSAAGMEKAFTPAAATVGVGMKADLEETLIAQNGARREAPLRRARPATTRGTARSTRRRAPTASGRG